LSKQRTIKVIIADTAFLIRKGLRTLIKENNDFEYITEVEDTKSLNAELKKQLPDVLIVDHCCDDCFSLKVINNVKQTHPGLNILVISHEKTADEIKKVIGIGIKNYLLKDCDEQEITDAIRSCAKGEKYFCGQIIDVLLEKEISVKDHCATGGITEREIDVIRELVSGKRPKEIADSLSISYYTVVTHKKNIYKKLGINHSIELAQYAIKTGLMK
jgi:DNA-binding NarL/FixJ family response regulator